MATSNLNSAGELVLANGNFIYALNYYGITEAVSGTVDGKQYDVAAKPLMMVRVGWVRPDFGTQARLVGVEGQSWTSTASFDNPGAAFYFEFNNKYVVSARAADVRMVAFSLRETVLKFVYI